MTVRFDYKPPNAPGVVETIDLEGLFPGEHIIGVIGTRGSFYENDLLEHLASSGPRGGTFIDVGANIGNHSIFFAKFLADHVVAVEPDAALLPVLRRNLAVNVPVARVTVVEAALGAHAGAGEMARRAGYEANAGAGHVQARYGDAPRAGQVSILTLDALVAALNAAGASKVQLVKLDVEGMELDVLEGATTTLTEVHPDLVIEASGDAEHEALAQFLRPYCYVEVGRYCQTPVYHFRYEARETPAPAEERE
jgi:protein O-GlcNAc transferase